MFRKNRAFFADAGHQITKRGELPVRKNEKLGTKETIQSYLMVAACVVGLIVFVVIPLIWIMRFCCFSMQYGKYCSFSCAYRHGDSGKTGSGNIATYDWLSKHAG